MELKSYQRDVIRDLQAYLECLAQTGSISRAYEQFWREKGVSVGPGCMPPYQNLIGGVPHLCFKVPTGGGKTFLACNAIRPVFDSFPSRRIRAVVWLVPSDAILEQTLRCLKDPDHPYRMKLNADFGNRVEVFTKQELLAGQNFSPETVAEQLSVMVLSYDSFRSRSKEGRKAWQENSNLARFAQYVPAEAPIENADPTALFQIINSLHPLVIVDESHHARSELSLEMLRNFNPCFVLDLTATPRKKSNVISFVDARRLKAEHMVKLPVIVYNRANKENVLEEAVVLRNDLERRAEAARAQGAPYIRPIVLLQAQPRTGEADATFDRLRADLQASGIPPEQIAVKTADINELKSDLLTEQSPVRYIITVNALREGWDCPFAYILASMANRSSSVEVEQIVGRVLRQPEARLHPDKLLNYAYVFTSSGKFHETLENIITGLNNAGFSPRDCRAAEAAVAADGTPAPVQLTLPTAAAAADEDDTPLDTARIRAAVAAAQETPSRVVGALLEAASSLGGEYEQELEQGKGDTTPQEVRDKMPTSAMNAQFVDSVAGLQLPQFFLQAPSNTLFSEGGLTLLHAEDLSEGFTLAGKDYSIDFQGVDSEMYKVDIDESDRPKAAKLDESEQMFLKKILPNMPPEQRVAECKNIISNMLNKDDCISGRDIRRYVDLIIGTLDADQIARLEKMPAAFARKIQEKVQSLLKVHRHDRFKLWVQQGKVVARPGFSFPASISPLKCQSLFANSLYEQEGEMNSLERELVAKLTAENNVRWWHRNLERKGFCLNGFINHYPDIIIMTQGGKLVVVETKGEHLANEESRLKLELGNTWAGAAGSDYRYYMIFEDGATPLNGAYRMSEFFEIFRAL